MNKISKDRYKLKRNCPICGVKKTKILFEQKFSMMSTGSILKGYNVDVCQNCGFGFADKIPEQDIFDKYYQNMSKYEYQHREGREREYDFERFQKVLDTILQFIPEITVRILDIGCATGKLLSLLKEKGYQNVLGIDPSPVCAETARRLYGISVLTKSLSKITIKKSFDFIIFNHALEHVRDIKPILTKISDILSDNGLVYIEVPDVTEFGRWIDAPFQQFSIEHINFFSSISLTNLMQSNGFVQVLCQQNIRKQSHSTTMPVICSIFKKENIRSMSTVKDLVTEQSLMEYILKSQNMEHGVNEIIEEIVNSGKSIIIWGVGTHTLRLLKTSNLAKANIKYFVDSNPRYQAKKLNNLPIIAPTDLKNKSDAILISSKVFQHEIIHQIRNELKCNNELILLYKE